MRKLVVIFPLVIEQGHNLGLRHGFDAGHFDEPRFSLEADHLAAEPVQGLHMVLRIR